ncbi:hypothetical protein H4R35_001836 [Dimargaris xerosporica]|nr:hypothetical protein H4R35_001836 [Dimargaris xerosporica]
MVSAYKYKLSLVVYVLVVGYLAAASPADIAKEGTDAAVATKPQEKAALKAAADNQQPTSDAPAEKPHEKEPPTDKTSEAELPKDKTQPPSPQSDEKSSPSKSEGSQKPNASRNQVFVPEPMPANVPEDEMIEPARPTPSPNKQRSSAPVKDDTLTLDSSEPRGPSDTKPAARKEKEPTRVTAAPQPTVGDDTPTSTRSRSTKWVTLTGSPAEKEASGRAQETNEEATDSNPSEAYPLAAASALPVALTILSASVYRIW